MGNSLVDKIDTLISRLENMRANIYPDDWDADPLYNVIKELRRITAEEKEKQHDAPPLRQVSR
ncbi:MAG: hypothetical protein WAR23_03700 [Dethiobacteria bacterium]